MQGLKQIVELLLNCLNLQLNLQVVNHNIVHCYAAILTLTCMPALVASVTSISRLNFSHLPLTRYKRRSSIHTSA